MMINNMQMLIGAIIEGALGSLLIMASLAIVAFIYDLADKIKKGR